MDRGRSWRTMAVGYRHGPNRRHGRGRWAHPGVGPEPCDRSRKSYLGSHAALGCSALQIRECRPTTCALRASRYPDIRQHGPKCSGWSTVGRKGDVWAAGDYGLAHFSDGKWTRFSMKDGLKSDTVVNVAEDSDGSVWIAYRESFGLTRLSFPPLWHAGGTFRARQRPAVGKDRVPLVRCARAFVGGHRPWHRRF